MVAQVLEDQYAEYEEADRFEKISHRSEWGMPSRRATSAKRAIKRASGSHRAAHRSPSQLGGKHQRRLRKFR